MRLFGEGPLDQRTRLRLREVRTGFVGRGLPARRLPGAGLPRSAPLMLGFHSGLRGNQADEDSITITEGPLAGGTTMHVSYLTLDLDSWYEQDADTRSAHMFSPVSAPKPPGSWWTTRGATRTTCPPRPCPTDSSATPRPLDGPA